jgi:hypothetical protein
MPDPTDGRAAKQVVEKAMAVGGHREKVHLSFLGEATAARVGDPSGAQGGVGLTIAGNTARFDA